MPGSIKLIFVSLFAAVGALALPASAQAATGLKGVYFVTPTQPLTLAGAATLIAGQTPDATFTATTICYPSCGATVDDATALAAFLGGNATDLVGGPIASLDNHVMILSGFLLIPSGGTFSVGLGSDDGSGLAIDGVPLLNDGDHGFGTVSQDYTLSAGLHAIVIAQFEDHGGTGLTVTLDGSPLGGRLLQSPGVPEPAAWAMMIGGFALAGAALRGRVCRAVLQA